VFWKQVAHAVQNVTTRIPSQIYNSFLAETTLRVHRNWLWGRAESADKDSTLLFEETPLVLLVDEQRLARVQAYTAGYERELPALAGPLSTGIGGQFTVYHALRSSLHLRFSFVRRAVICAFSSGRHTTMMGQAGLHPALRI
jgi:hypothetical protein